MFRRRTLKGVLLQLFPTQEKDFFYLYIPSLFPVMISLHVQHVNTRWVDISHVTARLVCVGVRACVRSTQAIFHIYRWRDKKKLLFKWNLDYWVLIFLSHYTSIGSNYKKNGDGALIFYARRKWVKTNVNTSYVYPPTA